MSRPSATSHSRTVIYRTAKLESKRRTGRKQTKWALCLSCPSAFLVLQHATGFFVQHEILVAKGLVLNLIIKIYTLEILPHFEGQQTADGSLWIFGQNFGIFLQNVNLVCLPTLSEHINSLHTGSRLITFSVQVLSTFNRQTSIHEN